MSREYCDHILDRVRESGPVSAKAMFGGYGLYRQGAIFAIIADDMLYYKADADNRAFFEDAGSAPFTYEAKGKKIALSYWQVPESVLEDRTLLDEWTEQACLASHRSANHSRTKQRRKAAS